MSIWYRCSQNKNSHDVFSGEGGLYVAGRWNHKGNKAIYCSQSISLCTLEWLAHNGLSVSGFSYYKFSVRIPEKWVIRYTLSDLPFDWNKTPATDTTRNFAETHFFLPNQQLAMAVPSVMVPEEYNLIINPLHQAFPQVRESISLLESFTAPHRI